MVKDKHSDTNDIHSKLKEISFASHEVVIVAISQTMTLSNIVKQENTFDSACLLRTNVHLKYENILNRFLAI